MLHTFHLTSNIYLEKFSLTHYLSSSFHSFILRLSSSHFTNDGEFLKFTELSNCFHEWINTQVTHFRYKRWELSIFLQIYCHPFPTTFAHHIRQSVPFYDELQICCETHDKEGVTTYRTYLYLHMSPLHRLMQIVRAAIECHSCTCVHQKERTRKLNCQGVEKCRKTGDSELSGAEKITRRWTVKSAQICRLFNLKSFTFGNEMNGIIRKCECTRNARIISVS